MNWRQRRVLLGAVAVLGVLWVDAFYGLLRTGIQVVGGSGRFAIEDVRFLGLRTSPNFSLLLPLGPIVAGLAAALYWGLRSRESVEATGENAPAAQPTAQTWDGRSKFPGAPENETGEETKKRRPAGAPLSLKDLALLANAPAPGAEKAQGQGAGKNPAAAGPEGAPTVGRTFDSPAKPDPLGLLDDPFVAAAAGTPAKKPAAAPEGKERASGRDSKKPRAGSAPSGPAPVASPPPSGKPKSGK